MEEEQHDEELQEQHDEEPCESQHDEEVEEQDEAEEEEEGYENENDEVYDEEEQRSSPPPSPPKRKTRRRKPPTTKGRQNPPEDAPPGGYGGGPTDLSLLPNFGKHIAAALWKGKYPERYLSIWINLQGKRAGIMAVTTVYFRHGLWFISLDLELFFLLESLPECSVLWETLSITSTELLTADLSTSATTCGTSPWNEGTRSSSIKLLINQSINHVGCFSGVLVKGIKIAYMMLSGCSKEAE
ncbi:hypothetical protein P8452_73272 [Trifolium repens]|nr:hypothetical protein P8452_73272 [Trifolium repens]